MKKTVVVRAAARMAPGKNAPAGAQGNIIINTARKYDAEGKLIEDNSVYLNQRDYRNQLLQHDMAPDLPCDKLIGSTITWDELEVTEAMIATGGGEHKIINNGREVSFKTPGKKMTNVNIIFGDFDITDKDINNMRMKVEGQKLRSGRLEQRREARAQATQATGSEVIIPDNQEPTEENTTQNEPAQNEVVDHENLTEA